ncbi:MAG: FecR family protein [Gammaproteobacteria bacterium]|nr:FecR family protein [Gammaproteobacteria bacterium]
MTTTDKNAPEEQDIARLLQAAGRREELPVHLKRSWEASFRKELAPVIERRKWRQHRRVFALCASFVLLALVGLFTLRPPTVLDQEIRVSRVIGEALVTAPTGEEVLARNDQQLEAGSVLITPADAYLSLIFQDYDLRLNSHSQIRIDTDGVHLLAGEIYISNESGRWPREPIVVHTPYATIRDIGTQFTVALAGDQVISTVRRGSIVVNTGAAEHTAEAGNNPHRITVNQRREVSSSELSAEQWTWIYPLAPVFEIEGSSTYDFLQWSVAESGLKLAFASDSAETYARITTLHGDISSLDPEQAVAPVLSTTHLRVQRSDANTLLVKLLPR